MGKANAYEALVESATSILISSDLEQNHGWLLSPDGNWFQCAVRCGINAQLWLSNSEQPIVGGMSGSPIVSDDGKAMGIVNLGGTITGPGTRNTSLFRGLPRWLLPAIDK
jgi:hypothetical protein